MYIHINVYIRSLIIHNKKILCVSLFFFLSFSWVRVMLSHVLLTLWCVCFCVLYITVIKNRIRFDTTDTVWSIDRSQHMQNALIHSLWPWLTHYLSCVRNIMKFEFDERACFCPRFYLTSLSNFEHWTNKLSNYADPVQGKQLQQPHQYTPINNYNNNN